LLRLKTCPDLLGIVSLWDEVGVCFTTRNEKSVQRLSAHTIFKIHVPRATDPRSLLVIGVIGDG